MSRRTLNGVVRFWVAFIIGLMMCIAEWSASSMAVDKKKKTHKRKSIQERKSITFVPSMLEEPPTSKT